MRVIAGTYRGRILKSPPSLRVRPTSDRLRETLFNIIAPRIENVRFLDLCTGSGAVGIEALSRGAAFSTFVDRSRKMCALVEANLDLLSIPESQTTVVQAEATEFLRRTSAQLGRSERTQAWDLIFFDPPYATDYEGVIELLGTSGKQLLRPDGMLIVEHHHKRALAERVGDLVRTRVLKQGESSLSFYAKGA